MIPKTMCQHRGVYWVEARNFRVAVYSGVLGMFRGLTSEVGFQFLEWEQHVDDGLPHGTVRPLRLLTELPNYIMANAELLKRELTRYAHMDPDDVPKYPHAGTWISENEHRRISADGP